MFAYETTEWNALTEEQRAAILKKAHETEEVISTDARYTLSLQPLTEYSRYIQDSV
jgi:predicted Fe-S protein YdhL (DUF1289 family)